MGVPLPDVDRVAVGRGAREAADADRAAGAADILDNHRLAERSAHLVGHDARGDVGRSARRERHDQRDRARGKIVGMRGRKKRNASKPDRNEYFSHVPSPVQLIVKDSVCRKGLLA